VSTIGNAGQDEEHLLSLGEKKKLPVIASNGLVKL
jgi:hypothetical protein